MTRRGATEQEVVDTIRTSSWSATELDRQDCRKEFAEDAEHVAYATVCRVDVLVSLNLRHLANEWAERRICAVNLREGYQVLSIRTPEEVLKYED
jgi:hypothetical protein